MIYIVMILSIMICVFSGKEIIWSDYISKINIINNDSYKIFKNSVINIIEHNKYNSIKWAETPFLHITTEEFSKRFIIFGDKILPEYVYNIKDVDEIFLNLPEDKYFSWNDKGVISLPVDIINNWIHVITSYIETYYKINYNIVLYIDFININSCYFSPYNTLISITKNNILLNTYERENIECIQMNNINLREIEYMSLPPFNSLRGTIDIYSSPIIVQISVDLFEELQFHDGNYILTLDSINEIPNFIAIIIGYGKESDGLPYWIVRTNFGIEWGSNGNFKLNPYSTGIRYVYQF
jgi:hypothetical protein